MGSQSELAKLQQHLTLLKQEYAKLQSKYNGIESQYAALSATLGDNSADNFPSRLLVTVSKLYGSANYSDIVIKLDGRNVHAHKIVLDARSNLWNEPLLSAVEELDWRDLPTEIGEAIILWLYTSRIEFQDDETTLKLIKQAHDFQLDKLVEECERALIHSVTVRNCVKFYSVAEEIKADTLRNYCSGLISTHWDDLSTADFEHMSGPLLYQMLKSKTQWPLHTAVRLQREDVVFLCLVEHSSRLSDLVNVWSSGATIDLPLDLALRNHNVAIATTLIQHNADLNMRDSDGDTLLHRAIKHHDAFSALYLLENNCDANLTTRTENDSPLHLIAGAATIENAEKIAEKLLHRNVNVNCQNRAGLTPLMLAIQADNRPIFELLALQSQLDLDVRNEDGHSALYYALLKYEAGIDSYVDTLVTELKCHTDVVYDTQTQRHLVEILLEKGAMQAVVFLTATQTVNVSHVNSLGESFLHLACKYNCPELVVKLLEIGQTDPNLVTVESRQCALHYAVKASALQCIRLLVDGAAVNFNGRDIDGDTPLSLALTLERRELVPVLIEGGADVNVRDGKDFTLLHQAILKLDGETALFLLENGADVNAKTAECETPLQLAIHCRLGDVVEALCIRGVDMSAPDRLGNCALWAALDSGQEDIASILVRHGADTDCWAVGPEGDCRQTLLHRAIDENKEAAAVFLVQAGCDLDSPRLPSNEGGVSDGASPLHLCCQWGLTTVVRTLIEHRANVNRLDAENKTPLHLAIENQQHPIINLLLSVPDINLSLRDKSGLTAFAAALTYRNNKAAEAILDKYPAAAEQFDAKGQNFLHVAIKKGDIESALFLLTVRVDVNSRVQSPMLTPPIHLAGMYANETLVRSLILAGARVDDRDAQKRTALHAASEAGNAAAVSALLQNGADFDAIDSEKDNALHIGVRQGHLAVVRALLTESRIDAEAINLKGRNPLHELCKYGKENAAAICELFLECMPEYPIDKTDIMGNSPLLLAYMNGNGNLCRVLVKANACLAVENNERVTIFNYQVASKQLLHRLLDQLGKSAVWWTNTDQCQECGKNFSITVRTHHCRHCGRALCSKCSDQEVPIIKFGENKPVRVCKVCFEVLKVGAT